MLSKREKNNTYRIFSSVGDFLGLDVLRSLTTGFSTAETPGDPLPPEMAGSCPKLTSAVLTGLISESSSRILAAEIVKVIVLTGP